MQGFLAENCFVQAYFIPQKGTFFHSILLQPIKKKCSLEYLSILIKARITIASESCILYLLFTCNAYKVDRHFFIFSKYGLKQTHNSESEIDKMSNFFPLYPKSISFFLLTFWSTFLTFRFVIFDIYCLFHFMSKGMFLVLHCKCSQGVYGVPIGFLCNIYEKGCKNHRETLYSSKRKIMYVAQWTNGLT